MDPLALPPLWLLPPLPGLFFLFHLPLPPPPLPPRLFLKLHR
jgi:hypothetical protein